MNRSLITANKLLRDKKYEKALSLYLELKKNNPELYQLYEFNINLCRTRLARPGEELYDSIANSIDNKEDIKSLLGCPISGIRSKKLPNKYHIEVLFETLSIEHLLERHAFSVLKCLQSSPFQRDLLWYAASIMNRGNWMSFDERIFGGNVALLNLMQIASNKSAWLKFRFNFKKWLEDEGVSDNRAWDLYINPPDDLSNSHKNLPKLRERNGESYFWHSNGDCKNGRKVNNIAIGTILLNESKFIDKNLLQHYEHCDEWVLVEGACQGYPERKVTENGLSLDDCATKIRLFPDPDGKIKFIQHGWTASSGEDAKSEMRNRYLEKAASDLLLVLDADEFYVPEDLVFAAKVFDDSKVFALTLPQIHFWKDTTKFITGEYYDISHTRFYRNIPGMKYIRNHNFPEIEGRFVQEFGHKKLQRTIFEISKGLYDYKEPRCYHMGFAKDYDDMRDKTDYYINRGEMETRKSTTVSRAAWFDDNLPNKCLVRSWGGNMPSVLISKTGSEK